MLSNVRPVQGHLTDSLVTVGRAGLLAISPVCLRRFSRQVVRPARQDELSGDPDVFASVANTRLDRKGH